MSRLQSTLIALVLGAAGAAGLFAAVQTVQLGQTVAAARPASAPAHAIALRRAKLARWSKQLQQAGKKRPPALPKLPKLAPVPMPTAPPAAAPVAAPSAAPQAAPAHVTYVRAAPVVEYRHASSGAATASTQSGSDDQGEQEDQESENSGQSSGGDDSGGDG